MQRDQVESDALIFKHLDQRQSLQARIDRLNRLSQKRRDNLNHDIEQYREIEEQKREVFEQQSRHQGPQMER